MEVQDVLGGRYHLQDRLGRGGMAVVWRAHDQVLGRAVAVKLLAGAHADDPGARRRIHDEARAAAMLSHPNVAQVYDFGETADGIPYVVMELVPGHTLAQHMAAGRLSPQFSLRICAEVAAGLAAAHADGLVHRDVKPANVMVTPTGAKVVDFGIAAATDPGGTGELSDEVLGTPAYLAPERLTGNAVEPASDVYALGVVLYKLLAGQSPWTADSTTTMFYAHVYVEPEPLPHLPDVPDRITDLCNRCLHKNPALRPTAREVATLLAQGAGVRVVEDDLPHALIPPAPDGGPPTVLVRGAGIRIPAARSGEATGRAAVDTDPTGVIRADAAPAGAEAAGDVSRRGAAPAGAPITRRRRALIAVAATAALAAGLLTWALGPGDRTAGQVGARPADTGPAAVDLLPATGYPAGEQTTAVGRPTTPASPTSGVTTSPASPASPQATPARPPEVTPTSAPARPRPTDPDPEPTVTVTTTEAPPPGAREFTSIGGSVLARCTTAVTAQIVDWTEKPPYKVERANPGPGLAPTVLFKRGIDRVRITVGCILGVPSATISRI